MTTEAGNSTEGADFAGAKAPNPSSVLVRALLAYSIYEHGNEGGTATRAQLQLRPRSCVLTDNGRGIGLHRDGYVAGLIEQLAVRGPAVHLHGLGLAVIALSSPSMTVESRRNGFLFKQQFAWGVALGPVTSEPWQGATGTRIEFTVADAAPEIDYREVLAQADFWKKAIPDMSIEVVCDGTRAL